MRTADDFGFIDVAPVDRVGRRHARPKKERSRPKVGNIVFAIVFSLVVVGWFAFLRPVRLGGTASFVMVQGTSMDPTYHTGDLVITHKQSSYAVGDVIAYEVPHGDVGVGLTVIHRIIGGSATTGFITQGDNNPAADDWRPKLADVQGSAWFVTPRGGRILAFLHAPIPLAGIAASVVVMWVVYQEDLSLPGRGRKRRGVVTAEGAEAAGAPGPVDGIAPEQQD
jgi:signal peptidase